MAHGKQSFWEVPISTTTAADGIENELAISKLLNEEWVASTSNNNESIIN